MGRFWVDDLFIDEQARDLSVYAQVVFFALSRHANAAGQTFVGVRTLGRELGINKDTVSKAIRELVASGLVGHCKTGKHRVSGLQVASVRSDKFQRPMVSDRRKGLRNSKESTHSVKRETLDQLRAKFVGNRFVA